jgi:nucleoside 2-deoxyribosyltransferase
MKIYIGGRISGLSYDEVANYFNTTKKELQDAGYYVYSPMTAKNAIRTEVKLRSEGYGNPESTNHAIFERDKWAVQQADIFYLNLTACEKDKWVSIGGMMELAWASMLGKHTVVSMSKENIHQHVFVLEAADTVYETHEEAMDYLKKLIKMVLMLKL